MPGYYHKANPHRHNRNWRRAHRTILAIIFVALILGVGVGVYVWQQSSVNQPPTETKLVNGGYYDAKPRYAYDNEIFHFESSEPWQFSREASTTGTKYIYYSQKNGIIRHELDIFFDKSLNGQAVNYILPVAVQNGVIKSQAASPNCDEKTPNPENSAPPIPQVYNNVKFICERGETKESIAAGVVGGGYDIPLYDSKGELRIVNLRLSDHTNASYVDLFKEIVDSFKLK